VVAVLVGGGGGGGAIPVAPPPLLPPPPPQEVSRAAMAKIDMQFFKVRNNHTPQAI
jgi:hypothetical protein